MLDELNTAFPQSDQVKRLGLDTVDDRTLWQYAKDHGFTIVTHDSDFHELATLYGAPPKIIWLKCGNRPRDFITRLLIKHRRRIEAFGENDQTAVIEIY